MLMLSHFFAQYGKKFVRELTDKARSQVGIDGAAYEPISKYTAKGVTHIKQVKHKKKGEAPTYTFKEVARPLNSRLNNTLQFRENAFVFDSSDYGCRVAVNEATYPGSKVSYADIVAYNDRNSPDVNSRITDGKDPHWAPSIFPYDEAGIEGLETYPEMVEELIKVATIQVNEEFASRLEAALPGGKIPIHIGV